LTKSSSKTNGQTFTEVWNTLNNLLNHVCLDEFSRRAASRLSAGTRTTNMADMKENVCACCLFGSIESNLLFFLLFFWTHTANTTTTANPDLCQEKILHSRAAAKLQMFYSQMVARLSTGCSIKSVNVFVFAILFFSLLLRRPFL
jgi:hypothetical protein